MIRVAFCALGLWLTALSAAPAAPSDAANKEAQSAAAAGQAATDKSIETINAARALTAEALSSAPLGFRRILFVRAVPDGFAAYEPRDNNVFTADEPLIVYTEPIGVDWTKDGDEFSTKLSVDFEIRSPDGKVLAGQRGFGEFALSAREPPLDFMSSHQARRDRGSRRRLYSRPDHARHQERQVDHRGHAVRGQVDGAGLASARASGKRRIGSSASILVKTARARSQSSDICAASAAGAAKVWSGRRNSMNSASTSWP